MDISAWPRGRGSAQFEPIFRENAIDVEISPELTEADLEKLGVVLGHRKRMLWAIAALGARPPAHQQRGHVARQRQPNNFEAPGLPSKGRAPRHSATAAPA